MSKEEVFDPQTEDLRAKIEALKEEEVRLTGKFDLLYATERKKFHKITPVRKRSDLLKIKNRTIASLKKDEANLNARWAEIGIEPPDRGGRVWRLDYL